MHLFRPLAILALLAAPVAAQTPAPASPPSAPASRPRPAKLEYDSLAFGRQFTTWFYAAQLDSLWAHTDSAMQASLGTKEGWNQRLTEFLERVGSELSLVEERWMLRNGARQYVRVFNGSEFTQEPVVIRWVLAPGKKVIGAGMNPLSRVPPADPE
jgi:hypothetical protein